MATPMRSGNFRAIVEPILNDAFDGIYDQRKDEWKPVFAQINGIKRSYHEVPLLYGMGAAPELPEGTPVTYQSGGVLFNKRYLYKVYGLAFAITQVLEEDGEAINIGQTFSKHLAQSMIETKETLTANVLNRAFNSSYLGGDGVSLINTAHPISGGTFSNRLTTDANLSQTSVEQMCIQVSQAVDNTGKKINLQPKSLVISTQNRFQAAVVLKSALRSGTNNNDLNPLKSEGLLEGGYNMMTRLTSPTAWFIKTDINEKGGDGLQLVMRRPQQKSMEGDFETDSMRYKSTERYDVGWADPRDLYGTPGV